MNRVYSGNKVHKVRLSEKTHLNSFFYGTLFNMIMMIKYDLISEKNIKIIDTFVLLLLY
jgi:hypothetical protein